MEAAMNRTEVMSQKAISWVEQTSEVIHDHVIPKIEQMPDSTAMVLFHLLEDAYQRYQNAGYSGSHHDGGSSDLLRSIEAYVHGWFKVLPREWARIQLRLRHQQDPEWEEYQRLKKKFERKGG
jgi:hypothetical protein